MSFSVDASQLGALGAELLTNAGRVGTQGASAVRKSTSACADTARSLAPERTGALRAGISSRVSGTAGAATGEVISAAPYSAYVEDGTSDTAPQPFMGPALTRHGAQLATAFEKLSETLL